jgi:hypothetical protein
MVTDPGYQSLNARAVSGIYFWRLSTWTNSFRSRGVNCDYDLTAQTMQGRERPAWQTALVALAILFFISEAAYLLAGFGAKSCSDDAVNCRHIASWLYEIFFTHATNEAGMQVFVVKTSFGLPGFNNLFYAILGNGLAEAPGKFLATVAASILVGFLAIWGYLATSAGRGVMVRLLLAIAFAIGWFVFYNNAEASVFRLDFFETVAQRTLEIPVATISLLLVSLFVRPKSS